jgi:hypothetical protein
MMRRARLILATVAALLGLTVIALHAAASYPGAVKAFSTKSAGDTIQPAHINDIQDEITAIENALLNGIAHNLLLASGKYVASDGRAVGDGIWTTPAFNAANFTATGGSWGVDLGDVGTLAYTITGAKMMTIVFIIQGTDVSSTPSSLSMVIPDGYVAGSYSVRNLIQVADAGTVGTGSMGVAASGTTVTFYRNTSGANWTTTSSDNTDILGEISFPIR